MGRGVKTMMQESVERRSEFRFPIVVPVEYFPPDDSGILSYTLDLCKKGAFISSGNHPISIGSRFGMNLNLPVDQEASRIFRTEGTVAWNRMQPFKSKRNGMGVQFIEPLPESLLLNALADNVRRLMKESEAKGLLEERVEKLEPELEEKKRLAALGRFTEKILSEVSNPILALSGKLGIIKRKMHKHKRMLEEHEETDKEEFKRIIIEFNSCRKEIDQVLKDYKIISELAKIVEDDRETLERKLQRYK
jgi:signal transduction histidine kinase